MPRMMIAVLSLAVALWSGYWYVASSAKFRVIDGWLAERRAAGWVAEYADFRVRGYPSRFDSRFRDLRLRAPRSGLGWEAPEFKIIALTYRPNHIVAAFADAQKLFLRGETVDVTSRDMFASVVFEPDTKLAVSRIRLSAEALHLAGGSGWRAGAESILLATRQNTGTAFAHDMVLDAKGVTPTRAIRRVLDPTGNLPEAIDRLLIDLTLGFTRPWDRVAIETGAPEVTFIDLSRVTLAWGPLGLKATGRLDVAPSGIISGKVELELLQWRELLSLLSRAGLIDSATARRIEQGLALLTAGAEDPDSLKVPLLLAEGRMSLGPVALGPAPRFYR